MRYVGDVHGKYRRYKEIIKWAPASIQKGAPASIQVGDLGVGFRRTQGPNAGQIKGNPPHALMVEHNARFIRGNHDNPEECRKHSQWIPDGYYDPTTKTMFIGGAFSIDREFRIKDYSWWEDEELSYATLSYLLAVYEKLKPEIMVTHDAPQAIAYEVLRPLLMQDSGFTPSRTSQAFQQMLGIHVPKLWIFGHYHISFDHILQGTRFVCLAELEYKDL